MYGIDEQDKHVIIAADGDAALVEEITNEIIDRHGVRYDVHMAVGTKESRALIYMLKKSRRSVAMFVAGEKYHEGSVCKYWPDSRELDIDEAIGAGHDDDSVSRIDRWHERQDDILLQVGSQLEQYNYEHMANLDLFVHQANINNVFRIVLLSEQRDRRMRGHSLRVAMYAHFIGKQKGLGAEELTELCEHGLIHDIGMLVTPDLLFKSNPEKTEDEYSNPEEHAQRGAALIRKNPFLRKYLDTVENHHKYFSLFDNGMPALDTRGLYRRIVTIADTIDFKMLRTDTAKNDIMGILLRMCTELEDIKLDTTVLDDITIPTVDLYHPAWQESRDFVTALIKDRHLLSLYCF